MSIERLNNNIIGTPPVNLTFYNTMVYQWVNEYSAGAGLSSRGWESGNHAIYLPVYVVSPMKLLSAFWANGSTLATYVEIGLYSNRNYKPYKKILQSKKVFQNGKTSIQYRNITPKIVGPGLYWTAMWGSSTSGSFHGSSCNPGDENLKFVQTSLPNGLPDTATPTESGQSSQFFIFGFTTKVV